jgi:hypothetical protein
MGFVQFPGSDTEPAKSGPGVAQQLQNIYTECLAQFDQIYVRSVLQKKGFFPSTANNNTVGGPQGNNPTISAPQVNSNPTPSQGNSIPGANHVNMVRLRRLHYQLVLTLSR